MLNDLSTFRKDLHQIPELGRLEFKTKNYILKEAEPLDCVIEDVGDTGIVLFFDNQMPHTIGFRADMDALPLTEATGLDFSSTHPGKMHACGHDGHMAILLGLAHYLHEHLHTLTKNVVLIFQPSEENEAGASIIADSGILEKYHVEKLFGLHLWPGLEKEALYSLKGAMMAAGSELDLVIRGKSAHVASAHEGIDTLEVACRLLTDFYDLEESLPQDLLRLLKFGSFHSGSVRNIISDETVIKGTLRSFDPTLHLWFKSQIRQLAQKYADIYNCEIEINYYDGYEAVINDAPLFDRALGLIPDLRSLPKPVMQSEDFSLYQKICPTLFFFLGIGETMPLHHPAFDFDMDVLQKGLDYFIRLLDI